MKDRICTHCHAGIEDEVHFLIDCTFYDDLRYNMFNIVSEEFTDFKELPSLIKYILIMNSKQINVVGSTIANMFTRRKLYS